jgi:hypothetical protein
MSSLLSFLYFFLKLQRANSISTSLHIYVFIIGLTGKKGAASQGYKVGWFFLEAIYYHDHENILNIFFTYSIYYILTSVTEARVTANSLQTRRNKCQAI